MKTIIKILGLSLITLFFIQTTSASKPSFGWIKGSGKVISETRNVSGFHGIDVGGAFEVILIKSNQEKIVLEADDNLMPYIRTKVFGGILEIDNEKDFRNPTELKVSIYYKNLDRFDISGAASVRGEDIINAQSIELDASGASEIQLKFNTENFEGDMSGASRLDLSGNAKNVKIEASGASSFQALEFETINCEIDASGAAVVRIWTVGKLSLEASGASSVRYKGNPSIDIISISGASSVRKY